MNQDQVKDILLKIEDSELEFSVTFTGKASKKVNGLYKSDTHEILLHNKNFSADNELLYTAIHEYTHHRLFELDGTRSGRVHTQRFWSYFHQLLQKAEEQGLYKITLEESPELLELTDTIRTAIMTEDGKLMKELGRLLGKARILCKQAGIRYEDYIDRVLCLPRSSASTMEKMHIFDIKPELGYEAMKVIANIANPDKRIAAEELFLNKKSPAFVRNSIKTKPEEPEPRRKLENEKRRIERAIISLQTRLNELENALAQLPVTPFIFCFAFSLQLLLPLTAENTETGGNQIQMPAIPAIPEVNMGGNTLQRPTHPVIQPPVFRQPDRNRHAHQKTDKTPNAASGQSRAAKSKPLNGLSAQMLSALAQNSGNLTLLNGLLGDSAGTQSDVTETVLTKILAELEKLQTQIGNNATVNSGAHKTENASRSDTASHKETDGNHTGAHNNTADITDSNTRKTAAELIRLRINGREIKDDLVYTFCSSPTESGTFLYGADRRFTANATELNETAYFLCRKMEPHHYEISMDLRQEPLNTNSYLYKLYELTPVLIVQTSDLLFWHYKAPNFEVELIFRVIEHT